MIQIKQIKEEYFKQLRDFIKTLNPNQFKEFRQLTRLNNIISIYHNLYCKDMDTTKREIDLQINLCNVESKSISEFKKLNKR